ncbi:MAG: hypothetical protein H3C62_02375 [Gemmatimonadaceae bacterium]|nr:hypothetical protein [Gemmatimonadaceae bacterium]
MGTEDIDVGSATPWGIADSVERILVPGTGVALSWVSTAGHGGVFVPAVLRSRIPAAHRAYAERWAKGWGPGWYEEDVAALAVMLAFPAAFPERSSEAGRVEMQATLERWIAQA